MPRRERPVNIIVACGTNRVIGKGGTLPWRIPEDTRYFHEMTQGGVCIMGRRCYEETGRAMRGRTTIVLTRDAQKVFPDALKAAGLSEAIDLARRMHGGIWICGGQGIYEESLALADRLYLTRVHAAPDGDTWFPDWTERFRRVVSRRKGADGRYPCTFEVLEP